MEILLHIVIVGALATAVTDLWALVRKPLLGVAPPDFALVGRWVAHMTRGRFRHDAITTAAPMRGERLIGWVTHYLIGVAFAAILVVACGPAWLRQPTLGPALAVGLATVAAPFLVMQPAMGAGIAASRTPRPGSARLQSIVSHLVFGFGLYLGGLASQLLYAI